jgi:hypothetical protein
MISKTFHSYKFCKSAHNKSTIKEHLFTSGHKSPRHIMHDDMGLGPQAQL